MTTMPKNKIEFSPGCAVFAKNFGRGMSWLSGIVEEKKSPILFVVRLTDGRMVKRHVHHLRFRESSEVASDSDKSLSGVTGHRLKSATS